MNYRAKSKQIFDICKFSSSRLPLILDLMRLKRSNYTAICKGSKFEIEAHSHEWYTLYENVIREDYFTSGITIAPGDTVVDIGSNFGSFTVLAAQKVGPTGRIISFEPNPDIYERLSRNIEINKIINATIFNEAVGGIDGEISLYIQARSSLTTTFDNVDHRTTENERRVTVKCRSLNSILTFLEDGIDLLKIDCEGAEYGILESLTAENAQRIKQISMEVHNIPDKNESDISKMLLRLGFKVYGELPMLTASREAPCG